MDIYRVSRRGLRGQRSKRSVRRRTSKRRTKRVSRRTKRVSRRRNTKRVSRRRNTKRVSKRRNRRSRRQTRRSRRVMRGGRPLEGLDLARDPEELDARMRREVPSEIFIGHLETFAPTNAEFIIERSAKTVAEEIIQLYGLDITIDEKIKNIVRNKRDELKGQGEAKAVTKMNVRAAKASKQKLMTGSTMTHEQAFQRVKKIKNHKQKIRILNILEDYKSKGINILKIDEVMGSGASGEQKEQAYMDLLSSDEGLAEEAAGVLKDIIDNIDGEYADTTLQYLIGSMHDSL